MPQISAIPARTPPYDFHHNRRQADYAACLAASGSEGLLPASRSACAGCGGGGSAVQPSRTASWRAVRSGSSCRTAPTVVSRRMSMRRPCRVVTRLSCGDLRFTRRIPTMGKNAFGIPLRRPIHATSQGDIIIVEPAARQLSCRSDGRMGWSSGECRLTPSCVLIRRNRGQSIGECRMWDYRITELVTLFVVLNPMGVLPIFVALTNDYTASKGVSQRFSRSSFHSGRLRFFSSPAKSCFERWAFP